MQNQPTAALRQAVCRRQGCHRLFFICRYCDRGQVYCSPECCNIAHREQLRAANRRYSQSPEAILVSVRTTIVVGKLVSRRA